VTWVTTPTTTELEALPPWATLVRAPNPGPMTLDGTNTWILRGPCADSAVVVDPGPGDEGHLLAVAGYAPVGLILLTHGHADHVEGAGRLSDLLGGVAIAAADPRHCRGAGPLGDRERIDRAGLRLRVLRTPGHTADSVCFVVGDTGARDPRTRNTRAGDTGTGDTGTGDTGTGDTAVLSGDTILGRGTTVVAWPDGDLGAYLASLRRLAGLGPVPVLPGHGPALADCAAAAGFYLRHRMARLDQVRAAVDAGDRDAAAVVSRVYADVDPALWPAAEWSVRAQLAYLDRESGR
jgi:glyoxylase-like metal-dependent hydrolase (beta-lactamase superfamily II)